MIGLISSIKSDIMTWLPMIPFILVVKATNGNSKIQINYTRLIELAVIALVTAGVSNYITVKVMTVEISHLEQKVDRVDGKVDRIIKDIYKPVIKNGG